MAIPLVNLSPFFTGDEEGIKHETQKIDFACRTHGFFRIVNHGIPSELMTRALNLSKQFFSLPDEEKQKANNPKEGSKTSRPAGYAKLSTQKNEYFVMYSPDLGLNSYPNEPAEFKEIVEESYAKFTETALLLQDIINKCMGLAPNFLKEYNDDRSYDIMAVNRYFPLVETGNNIALGEHQDANILTFVFQDEVGGLEVLMDGVWSPVDPDQGGIIVNISDTIQVLSNNKFKSGVHRVMRKETHRHSFAFFLNVAGDKWIEPLPEFTTNIGEMPKYKGFHYKEYLQLRVHNKTNPPSKPEDIIEISHYAI